MYNLAWNAPIVWSLGCVTSIVDAIHVLYLSHVASGRQCMGARLSLAFYLNSSLIQWSQLVS